MDTPICDFVQKYVDRGAVRMHMPGHKGKASVQNAYDITEIADAGFLYDSKNEADHCIARSESNATELFGCKTYYSTEGSSLCIRAMLYLCAMRGEGRVVLAARNAHQSFLSAAALLDLDVRWMWPSDEHLLSMDLTAEQVERALLELDTKPCCVYITSPDYLGHILPVKEIAEVCHARGIPLVVDNAHGAYLRFLDPSLHPCDLGADLCCDSAHKTLPVLTGGAYLHVSAFAGENSSAMNFTPEEVKNAMLLFASTSPSWLILQSLDRANTILADDAWKTRLAETLRQTKVTKALLLKKGYEVFGEEPCKITILTCVGSAEVAGIGDVFRKEPDPIEVEYEGPDAVVLMPSTETTDKEWEILRKKISALPEGMPGDGQQKWHLRPERVMSIREACMRPFEIVPLEKAEGRTAHMMPCSCPPGVQIVVCGEKIEAEVISCLDAFGFSHCHVVKN